MGLNVSQLEVYRISLFFLQEDAVDAENMVKQEIDFLLQISRIDVHPSKLRAA